MVYVRVPPISEDVTQSSSISGTRRMSTKTTTFKDVPNEGTLYRFHKKMDISRAIHLMNVSLSTKSLNTFVIYLGNSGSTSASIVSASMIRRTSSAKIYHHLSVEAPITKVISILMSAKESSPPYVAQALDKVSLHCIYILHTLLYKYY